MYELISFRYLNFHYLSEKLHELKSIWRQKCSLKSSVLRQLNSNLQYHTILWNEQIFSYMALLAPKGLAAIKILNKNDTLEARYLNSIKIMTHLRCTTVRSSQDYQHLFLWKIFYSYNNAVQFVWSYESGGLAAFELPFKGRNLQVHLLLHDRGLSHLRECN